MEIFSKQIFMDRLRLKRGERSQKVAAAMCDMKQPMYARYESGATLPSAEQLFRLCVAFDCSADYLLGIEDRAAPASAGPATPAPSIKTGNSIANVTINGNNNKISQTVKQSQRRKVKK